ncbi:MAG: hypothetical protein AAFY71_09400 [Bacteroidota bacterium]
MTESTKMEFTASELVKFTDKEFFPAKIRICQQVEAELASLLERMKAWVGENKFQVLPGLSKSHGKISRGENYHSYPYRVLDYPNLINKDNLFILRSMFLWGDSFSFHLILSGTYMDEYRDDFVNNRASFEGWSLAVHDDPWKWFAKEEGWKDFANLEEMELQSFLKQRAFFKISCFLDLREYEEFSFKAMNNLAKVFDTLSLNR